MIRQLASSSLFLMLIAGCGPRNPDAPASVTGHVNYKNAPVPAGYVTFHFTGNKGSLTAPLKADGSYQIYDLPVGEATVTVETESFNPKKKTMDYTGGKGAEDYAKRVAAEKPMKETPVQYVQIPAKYAEAGTSPLRATIVAGKQVKDFELTD